jgi:hypothetical protein
MSGSQNATPDRMTIGQLEDVLSKAFKEPDFAKQLQDDPQATLKGMGFAAHADEIAFFKSLSNVTFSGTAAAQSKDQLDDYRSEA